MGVTFKVNVMGSVGSLSIFSVPVQILLCTLGTGDLVCFIGYGTEFEDDLSIHLRGRLSEGDMN